MWSGLLPTSVWGQTEPFDTLFPKSNPLLFDTLRVDSLRQDTLKADSLKQTAQPDVLEDKVEYHAEDSLVFDLDSQKVFLYGTAEVTYTDITLKADYIEMDMNKKEVFAKGLPDSVGNIAGKPVFTQGKESFESNTLTYNFDSKRGLISGIVTEQEGGYLHSERTKKEFDGTINMANGKYTTCNAPKPHFYLALTKAKVIPNNKIVSGPAYLVVADVPLPVILPFGFFPNQQTHASGILIPEYGEEKNRGFFLRNGGYYFALSDYFDLAVTGDIFTNGTWGASVRSNYKVRYKFSGALNLRFYKNVAGDMDLGTYTGSRDYSISWNHQQDSKANPSRTFSANVNMSSSSFDQNHSYNTQDYLTNTKQSSISFSKRWEGSPFNFTGSLSHSQNSSNKTVNLSLPKLALTMNRLYPFRNLIKSNKAEWIKNIEVSYSANLDNRINTIDSLLFTPEVFEDMRNGFKHSIPLSTNLKPFRNFNVSPRVQYNGMLYTSSVRKEWDTNYVDPVTGIQKGRVVTDTIHGLQYAHALLPSIGMSLNPKIFGMFAFKNPDAKIVAIRHVISPAIGFSFTPDMRKYMPNYYDTVQTDTLGNTKVYSYFENGIFGTPSLNGKAGSVSFSLNNNVEMKVRTSNDTTAEFKKVKLLESLRFNTSYNLFADSMNLAPVGFSGFTSIFNKKLRINFGGTLDPYALNESGRRVNEFLIGQPGGSIARLTRFNIGTDVSFSSGQKSSKPQAAGGGAMEKPPTDMGADQTQMPMEEPAAAVMAESGYVDFNIPWQFSIRYNFNYSKPGFTSTITQTLNFNGNITLTPKWKIGVTSGWDFKLNTLTYTSVNIYRDLHCWEMRLSWIPIGRHQSYSFSINAKASILKDLKYEKRKSWYDN